MRRSRGNVFEERFRAHRVFHEIRRQVLNQLAAAHGFSQIETLMKIHRPIAVLAHAFARLRAVFVKLVQALVRVVGCVGRRIRRAHAKRAVARRDGQLRAFANAHAGLHAGNDTGRVVAFAIIADRPAQNLMHRQLQTFPFKSHKARSSAPMASSFSRPAG